MMNCRDCSKIVSLRDAMCPGCGRFLITDRPVHMQGSRSAGAVIALALVLDVMALFVFLGYRESQVMHRRAMHSQARVDALSVHPVAEKWRVDHPDGPCPTMKLLRDERELAPSSKITDPWNDVYRIDCRGEDTWVRSDGPDRRPGTQDDIVIPEPEDTSPVE